MVYKSWIISSMGMSLISSFHSNTATVSPCCFLNMASLLLSQGLCTSWPLWNALLIVHFLTLFRCLLKYQLIRGLPWPSCLKNHPSFLYLSSPLPSFTFFLSTYHHLTYFIFIYFYGLYCLLKYKLLEHREFICFDHCWITTPRTVPGSQQALNNYL